MMSVNIDILLFLQNIRMNSPSILTMFFRVASEMILYLGPAAAIIIYFAIDKRSGAIMGFNFTGSIALNSTVKLTCCVYRPWVLDSRIILDSAAAKNATGYSFPSGHTVAGTSAYGTLIGFVRKKWATVLFVVLILLTGLARCYLGAHTPMDVLVAMLETIVVMIINSFVIKALEKNSRIDIWIVGVLTLFCICSMIYFVTKSYPMDYDANGALLVDPVKMMIDGFSDMGMLLAWTWCWFIDRRYVHYKICSDIKKRVIRSVIALVVFLFFFGAVGELFYMLMDVRVAAFLKRFVSITVALLLYPYILMKMDSKKTCDANDKVL